MKAIIHKKYGPPEVAFVSNIDVPFPKKDEVLVRVCASTVNRTDAAYRSAVYFVTRFWSGLYRPKYQVLGCEFSGVIECIGEEVTNFNVGDMVFGYNEKTFGGHAEYLTISASGALATKPNTISVYDSAALTESAHHALNLIRAAKLHFGSDVLVYGASGAIGSAAIQILKAQGINVIGVCNTKNVDALKRLGLKEVIDYQTTDFTKLGKTFDFVFDAVGKSSYAACKPLLKEKGCYISTELGAYGENIFLAIAHWLFGSNKKVLFPMPTDLAQADVNYIKQLVESGDFKPLIDSYRIMEDIVDIYRYVESGQKTGNVILKIVKDL